MKRLLGGLLPFVLLVAVGYSARRHPGWPAAYAELLPYAMNLFAGAGLLLAWRFHRNRHAFLFVFLLLAFNLFWLSPAWVARVQPVLSLVLPLSLTALHLLPERALISLRAWPHYGVLGLAAALVWIYSLYPVESITALLVSDWVPARYTDWTGLPQTSLVVLGLLAAGLLGRWLTRPVLHNAIPVAVLLAVMLMLDAVPEMRLVSRWMGLAVLLGWLGIINETYRMAYLDELTELPARRALREQFQSLGTPFTLAMLDVDHFKRFNDRFGHDVGDNVLRLIAARMRQVPLGRPFRYGGEEFTLVFPGKTRKEVEEGLEAFRQRLANTPFRIRRTDRRRQARSRSRRRDGARRVQVTVSIGVADSTGEVREPWAVLKAADKALYRAKRKGRNQLSY